MFGYLWRARFFFFQILIMRRKGKLIYNNFPFSFHSIHRVFFHLCLWSLSFVFHIHFFHLYLVPVGFFCSYLIHFPFYSSFIIFLFLAYHFLLCRFVPSLLRISSLRFYVGSKISCRNRSRREIWDWTEMSGLLQVRVNKVCVSLMLHRT